MKFIGFSKLTKKDTPVQYRRQFNGYAVFAKSDNGREEKQIEFVIEQTAMGPPTVSIDFLEEIDYPLLPLIKRIKEHILTLYTEGKLL